MLTVSDNGWEENPWEHGEDIEECEVGMIALDVPFPEGPVYVLGDIFLMKWYTIYDRDNSQVGFALAKHDIWFLYKNVLYNDENFG